MTPTALTLSFRRAIRRSGLLVFRFHDLRHAFATALLRLGVLIPVVAEQLGHLDGGALVLSTYGYVASDMQRDAARPTQRTLSETLKILSQISTISAVDDRKPL